MQQAQIAVRDAEAPIPDLPVDATPEEKDRHWYRHVYQGDHVPQLTLRAVVMGGCIGMAMCCAHLYTVLAVGWSFSVAITACVMSYVIWNLLRVVSGRLASRIAAGLIAIGTIGAVFALYPALATLSLFDRALGEGNAPLAAGAICGLVLVAGLGVAGLLCQRLTPMSILENNCMQSTASAAGYSTGSTLATCFGALLIINGTHEDWRIVALFTLVTGAMGVWLAIPMKRQMINHEQLRFPEGVAAATTLRSLYSHGAEALRKAYALLIALGAGALIGFLKVSDGTLRKIEFLQSFFRAIEGTRESPGMRIRLPHQLPHDGWFQLHGKSIHGLGFDPSALLIAAGMIVGLRVSLSMLFGSVLLYFWVAPALIEMDQVHRGETAYRVSIPFSRDGSAFAVQQWSLWGGTALMVCASLAAIAIQWRTVGRAFTIFRRGGRSAEQIEMSRIEVPTSWFVGGLIPIMLAMLAVQYFAFQIDPLLGVVAIAMSFVLSLVAARSTGETGTTPTGAMGKVMQLLFGVLSPGNVSHNLVSAGVAANSASAGSDLLSDLKSGYLLGANPRRQFLAQFIGIFFGTVAILPCWYLMIPDPATLLDNYSAPATRQWEAVARLLTKGVDQLPDSARIAILIGGLIGVALPIIERLLPTRARAYMPSAMGLGLSWIVFHTNAVAFAVGATIVWVWGLIHRRTRDGYSVPIASGLIAGESLIQGIIAMLATAMGLQALAKTP